MYRCFIVLLFVVNYSLAAPLEVEKLQSQLASLPAGDSSRVEPLLSLANYYIYLDPSKAASFASQAVPISLSSGDDDSLAKALRLQGLAETFQGLNSTAYPHLTQAIEVSVRTGDPSLISVAKRTLGVFYELILDYEKALELYLDALKYANESDDPLDRAMIFNNIGNVLNAQGTYLEAASYFSRAIEIYIEINNLDMQLNATVGLGVSYLKAGDLQKATEKLEQVVEVAKHNGGFTFSEAMVNLAHVTRLMGKHSEAIDRYKFVLNDDQGSRYPPAVAAAYLGLGSTYELMGNLDDARNVYRDGLAAVSDKTSVESEMALYERLAQLELRQEMYQEAAQTQAKYIERRNEILPLTQQRLVTKLETQLALERDIIRLQGQVIESERAARNSTFYLFGIAVFAIISLLLFAILRLRKQALIRLEGTNKILEHASQTDPLTGIGNRRYLKEKMKDYIGTDQPLAFLLLDVDHFKAVNDSYGHSIGDNLLKNIADTVKSLCRKDELFARIGGEEFVVVLLDVEKEAALQFAERIRSNVAKMDSEIETTITVSIGVSFGNILNSTFDEMYKKSDIALYHAKSEGRNKVSEHNAA